MDFFIWLLFFVLGVAVGSGGTASLLRSKGKQESEQAKNGFEEQVATLNTQIRDMKAKMEAVREEGKRYWEELQREKKLRLEADEKLKLVPGIEARLQEKEERGSELFRENNELKESLEIVVQELEEKRSSYEETIARERKEFEEALAQERKAFEETLIFVQGGHYLPASVVRTMIRQGRLRQPESEQTGAP